MSLLWKTPNNSPVKKTIQIGITGGIGSGKSVISRMLRAMRYPVYDTDSEAKRIMDTPSLKQAIAAAWGTQIYLPNGALDRQQLSAIVFSNPEQLARLNQIVHPAVRQDYALWAQRSRSPIVFVESALLQESHMDTALDYIWLVEADAETRITRVMRRNNLSRWQVEQRIRSQQPYSRDIRTRTIVNDGAQSVMPQLLHLLDEARAAIFT